MLQEEKEFKIKALRVLHEDKAQVWGQGTRRHQSIACVKLLPSEVQVVTV